MMFVTLKRSLCQSRIPVCHLNTKMQFSLVQDCSVNYIVSINTHHQHQHGRYLGTEMFSKGKNHNKSNHIDKEERVSLLTSSTMSIMGFC